MKKALTLLLGIFLLQLVHGQSYDPSKVNKKVMTLYNQALQRAQDGNLTSAAGLLQQCIASDGKFLDAYLSLAGVYSDLKNYNTSIDLYEKAFAQDSDYTEEYKLAYSINLAQLGQFDQALTAINNFLDKHPPQNSTSLKAAQYRQRCYQFAVDYAKKNTHANYVFAPQNMGSSINSAESEYFPSLTIDGKELVFTRRLRGMNEDFFYSERKGTEWEPAKPVEGNVNTDQNEGAQNISQDGQWLVFTGCYRPDGFGGCDIYISYWTDKGWSQAENLGGHINSDQWESQPSLSPDKKDLYFSSKRFGGLGGSDIYVCHLQSNGRWSDPENLGPQVNTPGDEECPFIHADNQTLYFTSNYWPGYGDADLFYTRKGPNGDWSKPVNLGYPINTVNHEGTLFVAADGKTAYFSSDRSDTHGGLDIYTFELREDIRPYKTLWVKGKVFDKTTSQGLPSSVELIDLASHKTFSKTQTDENGNYLITLPVGKDYAFNVNRKGYLFYSDNFSLRTGVHDTTFEKNIPLQPLQVDASIVLNNIFFSSNKFDLEPASETELNKIVELLQDNPTVKILVGGYTDNVGKPTDNLTLSNNRAKAVVNYLVSKGIAVTRLSAKGFGETQPVADNSSDEGRARNRRTEMKIVAK